MAIAILSAPDYIQPVYSVQEWQLYDASNYAQAGFYYQLTVTIGAETRTLQVKKDENNKATFDVQAILQPFLVATFAAEDSSMVHSFPDIVLDYSVVAKSVWDAGDSTSSSVAKKAFYGVDQFNRTWDASLYEFRTDSSGLFLTSNHTERDIHYGDVVHLNMLYGKSNGIDSSFNGLAITRYQASGDTSTFIYDWTVGPADVSILSINLDPAIINDEASTNFIDGSTLYFTVAEKTGLSETIRINILLLKEKYDRYYRIQYIDSLGNTEAYNFDLVPENDIAISKTEYIANRQYKAFGTKVENTYLVRTDWMCEDKSAALKDLWYSPKASLVETDLTQNDIILLETGKKIANRHNVPQISYDLKWKYADEFIVQFQ